MSSLTDVATVRVARLANLFGPGQRLAKPQGLLSHLVANALRNRPTQIFVPLDTARDYLWTGDAARDLISLGEGCEQAESSSVRVIASGHTHTIAEVVATLGRLLRRRVPLTHSIRAATSQQPRLLAFRPDRLGASRSRVSLAEGMRCLVDLRVGLG